MEYKQSGNFLKSGLMTALAFTILSSPFALSNHSLSFEKAEFSTTNSVMERIDKTYNSKFARAQMQLNESDGLDSQTECWLVKSKKHPLL